MAPGVKKPRRGRQETLYEFVKSLPESMPRPEKMKLVREYRSRSPGAKPRRGRPPLGAGKGADGVVVSTRLTLEEAKRLDRLRGETSRAAYLHAALSSMGANMK